MTASPPPSAVGVARPRMLSRLAHPYRLSLASLLVFLVGVPTIFLTRLVFQATRPEYFATTIPTISKSSAFAPASDVFLIGMLVVAPCIVISWWLVFRLSRERARALSAGTRQRRFYLGFAAAAAGLGVLAGLSLASLAIITLETNDPAHIVLSYAFFVSQLAAYLADTCGALLLNRALAAERGDAAKHGLGGKPALCLFVTLLGFFFLFLFLARDQGVFQNEMLAQGLYVLSEYVLATLCFAYAALYFPELRGHFRASFDASIARPGGFASARTLDSATTPSNGRRG